MNRRPTIDGLHARLDALCEGPLTADEQIELAALEQDFRQRFPTLRDGGPEGISRLTDLELEDYLEHMRGNDGQAQRHYQLRQRARSPEQIEADRIEGERIARMTEPELEEWVCAQLRKY